MGDILIVEDESIIRSALKRLLERNKYRVTEAESVTEASQNDLDSFDLIISDLRLPGAPGTDLITAAANTPVLIMTSYASMRSAVDAMKMGAVDYIAKPFDHEDMIRTVRRIIEEARNRANAPDEEITEEEADNSEKEVFLEEDGKRAALGDMVGSCEPMQNLYRRILRVAPADITVLIQGESGTGKELAARAIHQHSLRKDHPLICVNCAAIPESLIESELFGHEKGSFTGASTARQGLVEAAEGGTLFLDEIGELPMEAQARLLRVLQENEVRRVGSVHARKVDVRLVAATHRNLKKLVKEGLFREDLYYRLQVIEIALPPLRDRMEDVIDIAEHLVSKHCRRMKLDKILRLTSNSRKLMMRYDWPGNIRELENAVQRAIILSDDGRVHSGDLGISQDDWEIPATLTTPHSAAVTPIDAKDAEPQPSSEADDLSLESYFHHFVIEHQDAMSETELAQKLGISRKCLWERRQRLGIPRPKKAASR
ncbi:sigma-54-dependent transcriptional regulator [Reinekea marinisedimentorum]|uniref:DNA-binding NtrC family response regulator n=1 Tax=Reinekea marinisedimentorum TaxID=230495 RepID=A0A4R3I6N3_9GAMM|nr:sigma-54 dependent transcriptional regulator [Reinekea marinisedimentorum]TCS41636.1 DNA-binding NtrC family response regulator [Reinekea marinisedimentorum]